MGVQNFNAKKFQAKMNTLVDGVRERGSMKAKKVCAYYTNAPQGYVWIIKCMDMSVYEALLPCTQSL